MLIFGCEGRSMRLLYWYTRFLDENGNPQKYHGLDEFELNLSTDTKYHFDANTSVFTQEPYKTPLPEKFWGDKPLYNINVIVGQNGDGKTTVVHTVMDTLQELYKRELKDSNETVFLAECNEKHVLFYLTGSQNKHKKINGIIEQIVFHKGKISTHEEYLQYIDGTKLIYIANTLSEEDLEMNNNEQYNERYNNYIESYNIVRNNKEIYFKRNNYDDKSHVRYRFLYDCSLYGLIQNEGRLIQNELDIQMFRNEISNFFCNEYYKQVKFVYDRQQRKKLSSLRNNGLSVPIPKQLSITIRDNYKGINFSKYVQAQETFAEKLAYRLCVSCYLTFIDNLRIDHPHFNNPLYSSNDILPNSANYGEFEKLFTKVEIDSTQTDLANRNKRRQQRCLNFVSFVCETKEQFNNFYCSPNNLKSLDKGLLFSVSLPVTDQINDWLVEFIESYRLTCAPYYFLDFNWGLSSGENNLLRMFSSIYYVFYYSDSNLYNWSNMKQWSQCNSVVFLMDEADLTYHPEWQRQLIKILAAFLPLEFGNCGIDDLQVILTTHSPLLLGDIPSNNVTYLRQGDRNINDNNLNSFGQNIHNILKDSFFLESTIGAFATDKINKTAKKLRDMRDKGNLTQNELRECKAIIDLLAPGVIKSKLIELYEETRAKCVDKKKNSMEQFVKELSPDELANLFDVLNEEKKRRDNDKN